MCVEASSSQRNPLEVFNIHHTLRVENATLLFIARRSGWSIDIPIKYIQTFEFDLSSFINKNGSITIVFGERNQAWTTFKVSVLSPNEHKYVRNIQEYIMIFQNEHKL